MKARLMSWRRVLHSASGSLLGALSAPRPRVAENNDHPHDQRQHSTRTLAGARRKAMAFHQR